MLAHKKPSKKYPSRRKDIYFLERYPILCYQQDSKSNPCHTTGNETTHSRSKGDVDFPRVIAFFCLVAGDRWGLYHHISITRWFSPCSHYNDVIMTAMVSQITSLVSVYSRVYSGADQRKHQSSASLAFVKGIHRWPVNSTHKRPVTRKMFPFDDVIMLDSLYQVVWSGTDQFQ